MKSQKILICGRPGGGWSVISDTPGRGGEGGSKKGRFLRTSFMDGPLGVRVRVIGDGLGLSLGLLSAREARKTKVT